MAKRSIEAAYAKFLGLEKATQIPDYTLPMSFSNDFENALKQLRNETQDEYVGFDLPREGIWRGEGPQEYRKDILRSKILQIIEYLKLVHQAEEKIVQVGSAYSLIVDRVLKSRCSDLLSAEDHFDRVVNQATQVLEDRIRKKLPDLQSEIGEVLVGKAINPEPAKTRIKFSDNPSEQSGYAALFRGMVGAFRNPAHHRFLEEISREQSLQICAFIDNLLSALETATIVNQQK